MKYSLLIVLVLASLNLYGQSREGLVTYLSMDGLPVLDESEIENDLVSSDIARFGCGVVGQAAYFDGNTSIEFLTDFNAYFRGNFTLSFDFKPSGGTTKQIIFSKASDCLSPKDFEVSYIPSSHSLGFIMSESFDKRLDFVIPLDHSECWYHVDIVRAGPRTLIYVNNKLVRESNLDVRIDFSNSGFLSISQSPCIPMRAAMYEGYLDEVRIYNRPLQENELFLLYNKMNKIVTNDTLVYIDSEIQIKVTDDCTESYSWAPTFNVSNPTIGNTTISAPDPGEYTYVLTFREEFCRATDTLKITVVDPGNVNCESLIMPSAFTPNEDRLNDIYRISNPFIVEELLQFQIFDRAGGLLFQTSDASQGWDGKYRGEYVSSGTYFYRITHICNGEKKVLQGNVVVLR